MTDENQRHPEPELSKKIIPLKESGLLKVIEWPDGTIISINTEKGKENLRIHHSSGVYHEFTSEGTAIQFSSNNSVNYSKGGMTVTYDNSGDTKASGHMRVNFDHDAHVTFQKNASIVVGAKANIASLGELKIAAKGNLYLGAGAKVCINGGKGVEINGHDGRVEIEASGVVYLHSKSGDVHLEAAQDVVGNAGGDIKESAQGSISETAQGNINNTAQGDGIYDMSGTGKVGPNAQKVQIKPGGQQITPTSDTFV